MTGRVPSRHWTYWLGAAAVGVGIALGAGHGVAAADAGTSGAADSSTDAADQAAASDRAVPATAARTRLGATAAPAPSRRPVFSRRPVPAADMGELKNRRGRPAATRPAADDGAPPSADSRPRPLRDVVRSLTRPRDGTPFPAVTSDRIDATAAGGVTVAADPATPVADAVSGIKTGHSTLDLPIGTRGFATRADWYFPTRTDGSVAATGVIYLQHGFMGRKFFYSALAESLSQRTNSIVVVPNLPSFPQLRCGGCWINGASAQRAVAEMFTGDEAALNASAAKAGFVGTLPENFVLTGHSAGGGLATAAAADYVGIPDNGGRLRGVVMFDGFAFSGVLPAALATLDDPYLPVYQVAAPPQPGNLFGAATKELVAARPDRFVGTTLVGGSHVDSLIGGNAIVDFFAQLVTKFSPPGNTAAVSTLASGWITDLYRGLGPADGSGIYGQPGQSIVLGDATGVVLGGPSGPQETGVERATGIEPA